MIWSNKVNIFVISGLKDLINDLRLSYAMYVQNIYLEAKIQFL